MKTKFICFMNSRNANLNFFLFVLENHIDECKLDQTLVLFFIHGWSILKKKNLCLLFSRLFLYALRLLYQKYF